jgi:hypothetical protein
VDVCDLSYALRSAVKTTALKLDCVTSNESFLALAFAIHLCPYVFYSIACIRFSKKGLTAVELGVFALTCASLPFGIHAIGQRPPGKVVLPQLSILDPFHGVAGHLLHVVTIAG